MNAFVGDVPFDVSGVPDLPGGTPDQLTLTRWGYIIDGSESLQSGNPKLRSILTRTFGTLLFIAGITLWVIPAPVQDTDFLTMKMGAMLLFTIVGITLIWAGRQRPGIELQVDLTRNELRLGNRDLKGNFILLDQLWFNEVTSIYLMRPENPKQPARLYLRIGANGATAIEIARGKRHSMEVLRQRLLTDLTYRPEPKRRERRRNRA